MTLAEHIAATLLDPPLSFTRQDPQQVVADRIASALAVADGRLLETAGLARIPF